MKKNVIVFGLIAGFMVSIWLGVLVWMCMTGNVHLDNGMWYGYGSMIIAFSMVFVGIKNYRDKHNGGAISFGQAFKVGGLIALIACTIYVLVWVVSYYTLIPDFMEKYAAHYLEALQKKGVSAQDMEHEKATMAGYIDNYKNPLFVVLFTYLEVLPVALVVTLVSALILKKKKTAVVA